MSAPKERPILFSAPMVRAILNGTKTQTRRIIKPQPLWVGDPSVPFKTSDCDPKGIINCPYGKPGDRLWVRETWQGPLFYGEIPYDWNSDKYKNPEYCYYRASGHSCDFTDADDNYVERWSPSIHMPRWASRILLEVVNVRVERLQDISEDDAIAEGCIKFPFEDDHAYTFSKEDKTGHATHTGAYRNLWESINGPGSWDLNPWVWVVEFKVIEKCSTT